MKCPFCGKLLPEENWLIEVQKFGRIHEARIFEFGKGVKGHRLGWSLRDSANLLNIPYNRIRNIMIVYRMMKKGQTMEKFQNLGEAVAWIERKKEKW